MALPVFVTATQMIKTSQPVITLQLDRTLLQPGHLMIVEYTCSAVIASSAMSDTPQGWTAVFPYSNIGTAAEGVWYKFFEEGEINPTWTQSSLNPVRSLVFGAWSGVNGPSPIDVSGTQSRTGVSADTVSPSVTTTDIERLLVLTHMAKDAVSTAVTDPAGTTRRAVQFGATGQTHALLLEAPALTAGATPVYTATWNAAVLTANGRGHTIALTPGTPPAAVVTLKHSMIGNVTHNSADIVARVTNFTGDLTVSINGGSPISSTVNENGIVRWNITGLEPHSTNTYDIRNGVDPLQDSIFQTFPEPGVPASLCEILFGSCQDTDSNPGSFVAGRNRATQFNPNLFIHLGDLHYLDIQTADEALARRGLVDAFTRTAMYGIIEQIPTVYTWDNHDWAGDGSDKNALIGPSLRSLYREIMPSYDLPSTNQAIYHSFVYGRVRFIVLDTRSQRDPVTDPEGPNKTMLGAEQKQWLKDQLVMPEPVKIIACGIMWRPTAGSAGDRWGSYTTEFAEINSYITDNVAGQVYVISGDRHALAADDGTNTAGTVPNVVGAPFYRDTVASSETWSHGYYRVAGYQPYYGFLTITDDGENITVKYDGWDSKDEAGGPKVTMTTVFEAPFEGLAFSGFGLPM